MSEEEKLVAAIDRNTEAVRSVKRELGNVSVMLGIIWLGICVVGCPHAKAYPLLTVAPDPPALQYWHTVDIPMDGGVYPLEVYAPALPPLIHQPRIVEIGDPPVPPVDVPEPGTLVMVMAYLGVGRACQWCFRRKATKQISNGEGFRVCCNRCLNKARKALEDGK